ncbi:MAG: hypothetical protein K2Y16_02730 [Burkholderiales bacterium]|nr:hypothetical protein [Burkholderiales bacterium]
MRAALDGYTWMMLTSQLLVASSVYPNLKFNLDKDFASISLIGTVPFVQVVSPQVPAKSTGRVRALGVTSRKRSALIPDVPSISEAVPGYEMLGWYSLVAPTGTPPAVLAKVSVEVVKASGVDLK